MNFDRTHQHASENDSKLSPAIAAMMAKAFYSRRDAGLNVQFIREDGKLDEWSFANAESRDKFVAKLNRDGLEYALSA